MLKQIKRRAILLVGVAIALGGSQQALAVGTAANVTISNTATINYTVGTIAQAPINANADFVVDNRVDLSLTCVGSPVSVVPGQTGAVLPVTLLNEGNEVMDFRVGVPTDDGGDDFDTVAASLAAFVDVNGNGTYEPATDTDTFVDELVEDTSITVFIVGDIPATATDGQNASVNVVITTAEGASVGLGADETEDAANTALGVEVVFGDPGEDGNENQSCVYTVATANLAVTKTSSVISAPFAGGGGALMAIPGSVIRYTISITNNGSAAATGVSISDDLDTEITAGTIAYNAGTINVTSPNINENSTDAGGDDNGDFNATGVNTVTVTGINLLPTEAATITFDVTVQ